MYPSRNMLRALLLPLIAAAVLVVATAGPAAAKSTPPCWKTLINDWYDGRIDGTYPIHCYREALNHLPTDVETYSSARDDIRQALQERITQSRKGGGGSSSKNGSSGGGTGTGSNGGGGASGGGSSGGGSAGGGSSGGGSSGGGSAGGGSSGGGSTSGGSKNTSGPIGDAFNSTRPGSADSVPVPLIVLGAVALLLMAAGAAGFVARRMRTRKLQLASAATLPRSAGEPPSKQP
jgi:hypothetical protein